MPIFVNIILPLSINTTYTYKVPQQWERKVATGKRVEVQFGAKRIYAAMISRVFTGDAPAYKVKPIVDVLDDAPIINLQQLKLWQWMAHYYMCSEGEVMMAALPSAFKLSSQTQLSLNPSFNEDFSLLNDSEYLIAEALISQDSISIADVQEILQRKTVFPLIKSLIEKGVVLVHEKLIQKYKARKAKFITLQEPYLNQEEALKKLFDDLARASKQLAIVMAYWQLRNTNHQSQLPAAQVIAKAAASSSQLNALVKKGVFSVVEKRVSRLNDVYDGEIVLYNLSPHQKAAKEQIEEHFTEKNVVLLHGITSSGKTQVYIELIKQQIAQGKQVLYLLPEIALTSQMIARLRKVFGSDVGVYHSKFNNNERIEIWQKVIAKEYKVLVGARSALFLPFVNLGLIIVDEEHDQSFKQFDPAPRYHARDSAIYLGTLYQAKILLGSATPSMESYYNAITSKKYGLVSLTERFGGVEPPKIELINISKARKQKQMKSVFSNQLLSEFKGALERGEQVIVFQNRRGYAPIVVCDACSWIPQCYQCDVSLTYHKYSHELKCHYCGYRRKMPSKCDSCETTYLKIEGFGTEKIEDELQTYFPKHRLGRLDLEVARTKTGFQKVINSFERKEIDILVGTQMITKGLDFGNVSIVGILSADKLINFPDFRAAERAYQLMLQVSGRAGRRSKQGKVLIQTLNPNYRVLNFVLQNNYHGFYSSEIHERMRFSYPPYVRTIALNIKNKHSDKVNASAFTLVKHLKAKLGNAILGPSVPYISRVRNYYIREALIKLPKNQQLTATKQFIAETIMKLKEDPKHKSTIVQLNVDP